ncbi:MAG: CotH kinase family protein [Clostridia bacterium]|nr:CotH kinase family protein [Clostridia bacterium]
MRSITRYTLAFLLCLCMLLPTANLFALAAEPTQVTNLPTLYITLDNGVSASSITKEKNLPATFSMRAESYDDITDAAISIKGRGNSTWQLPKKPYQIKFEKKTDLLGMGASKKWILLANYWDKTLMRNAITYELANKMNNIFSVQCKHVDVYLNGQYQGNYLLCEKIEFGGSRIDDDTDDGAVLMELEQLYRHQADGCDCCVITDSGVHVTLKEPEPDDDFTTEQMEAAKSATVTRLNEIEAAIAAGYDAYSKEIDVQSFLDWYIQNELAKNYDAAFVTSSYCYLSNDGQLHMGPVWDVDVCFGNQDVTYPDISVETDNGLNYYNYRADKGAWYMKLFEDETFVQMLKARWKEIKELGYLDQMLTRIDELQYELCDSQFLETQRWPDAMMVTSVRNQGRECGGIPYFTFDDEVDYFKYWLTRRIDWLDSQWNDDYVDMSNYQAVATLQGAEIAPKTGTTQDGAWIWNYTRYPSPINRRVQTSKEFFLDEVAQGSYVMEIKYKYTLSATTDGIMLRLKGINEYGDTVTLYTTTATRTTYLTAPKDANGYATLRIPFNTAKYPVEQFYGVIEAYNGTVSIPSLTLYCSALLYGDVDQNGNIEAADALEVLKSVVGKVTLTNTQTTAADTDGNNNVDASDALNILKKIVGKLNKFPVEE